MSNIFNGAFLDRVFVSCSFFSNFHVSPPTSRALAAIAFPPLFYHECRFLSNSAKKQISKINCPVSAADPSFIFLVHYKTNPCFI
ncbi:hypothetical protein CW304_19050 [Bacillus sp. UFRGS-B20]|nr:hypothetical protein CW304_19050 [Bacillus sp. UFRGS-B20]